MRVRRQLSPCGVEPSPLWAIRFPGCLSVTWEHLSGQQATPWTKFIQAWDQKVVDIFDGQDGDRGLSTIIRHGLGGSLATTGTSWSEADGCTSDKIRVEGIGRPMASSNQTELNGGVRYPDPSSKTIKVSV
jgi:hypothetical protein